MNELIRPLTIHELLEDPIYKRYLLKAPKPRPAWGAQPWRVWGLRTDDKWAGKLFPTYREAFDLLKVMIRERDKYTDAVITCRPSEFGPPKGFLIPPLLDWCGYCRRPTVYRRLTHKHHVIKKWPVFADYAARRCIYCASREPQHRWYAE